MNGRVYDYNLGRFMSVDPIIQAPANSQSMNPYSYIMNNQLSGTDPSGYVSDELTQGNSDTGGSGVANSSPSASTAQRVNISQEARTGSRITNTKVTVGDGSVTLDRSGNIVATSGNPSAALAAIGQAMAMNASQGSGATNSPTTEDGGGADAGPASGGSGSSNVDIGRTGDAPSNNSVNISNASDQADGTNQDTFDACGTTRVCQSDNNQGNNTQEFKRNNRLARRVTHDNETNTLTFNLTATHDLGIHPDTAQSYFTRAALGWTVSLGDISVVVNIQLIGVSDELRGADLHLGVCTSRGICGNESSPLGLGAAEAPGRNLYYSPFQLHDTPIHELGHIFGFKNNLDFGTGSIMGPGPHRSVTPSDIRSLYDLYR